MVVVLGHSQCGAVTTVVDDTKLPANIGHLVAPIQPAVDKARQANLRGGQEVLIAAAITANVCQALADILQTEPVIRDKVKAGQAQVVGALYELDTGKVQWLGPHPGQEKLVGGRRGRQTGKKERSLKYPRSN